MTVASAKFTRKKEQAIANLLQYPTIAEAAAATGIAEVTLFRWLQDPEFAEAYRAARRETVSQAVAYLQQTAGEAVQALREILANSGAPTSSRVTAARTVLEMALKAVELEDLEKRVTALEKQMDTDGGMRREARRQG